MIVWDVSDQNDAEEIYMALLMIQKHHNKASTSLLLKSGTLDEMESSPEILGLIKEFGETIQLEFPFGSYESKALLFSLMRGGLDKLSRFYTFNGTDWESRCLDRTNSIVSAITELVTRLDDRVNSPGDVTKELALLLGLLDADHLGELGIQLRKCARQFAQVAAQRSSYLYQLRQVGERVLKNSPATEAMLLRWKIDFNAAQRKQIFAGGELEFCERVAIYVERCRYTPNSLRPNVSSSCWPKFFALNAGWFFRIALLFKEVGQFAVSIMCLIRSLELVLQGLALDCGAAHISPSNGQIYFDDGKAEGCGVLVGKVKLRVVSCKIKSASDLDSWSERAFKVLAVRNQSLLAHGILVLDGESVDSLVAEIRELVTLISSESIEDEFLRTISNLRRINMFSIAGEVMSGVSKEYASSVNLLA